MLSACGGNDSATTSGIGVGGGPALGYAYQPPAAIGRGDYPIIDSIAIASKGLLDLPMEADPGTRFAYNTIASVSLCQAIQNQGPLTCVDFLKTYLLDPLNIARVAWVETPTGLPDLGGGLYLSGRDMLKFGQMHMDDGRWNGQQIISSE